jgi:glycosyltransferase involved in cell wall biosynthesis
MFLHHSSIIAQNALCEAQLVGMPLISTYTGGVPSLVEDGKNGFLFPTGDKPILAAKLRAVFENDDLARQLGGQANIMAWQRHAPDRVMSALVQAYEDVLCRSRI